ncbi:alanine/glycine:cation symporter family protein [Pseudobacteriovorax antillogorgiicola]|uniref:Alanine or glycine:cation symporter, AGCS family n=1 Tax=Pseudobacteriovorax antillogorgiicola TaxID=1513793 RepID=A0A1Y6CF26_9BACT|nr:alanine/glycine:cation symporter family protein [Pseudobacteriovorax antillogorgiicola]TCS47931.1 AGCS family alanine or glycine:cation symporter [Pseudobacteriovorax antillogorgiicola]SMF57992.1 alanine or glycine:cation symporter, AGCS family [Pseudobacteriovorax antillogorgiicola]
MTEFIGLLKDIIWSNALIALCLGAGLYFSLRTRFVQLRHVRDMFKLLTEVKESDRGVSSFQALAMSISGRVGTGNIAGVATAIAFGGPGAIFWMWVIAFFGSSSAYIESTLAQLYKVEIDGELRGGPAYFIDRGLGWRPLGIAFAIVTLISAGFFLPGIQANSIAIGMENAFGIQPSVTAVALLIGLGLIIFGGVKRISHVAEKIVPFMAVAYVLLAIGVIMVNISELPRVLSLIISSAFGMDSTFGGILGSAVSFGVKRGIYSNEAGQGTGPHAAAAAEVSHPAKQGLVQCFSVYIDTLFICTATAFMILLTGAYNTYEGGATTGAKIFDGMGDIVPGPAYTQQAVETVISGAGAPFVAISLLLFAFTTLMAYYYIAETNVAYLTQHMKNHKLTTLLLRVALLFSVGYGTVQTAGMAWDLGDIGVGLMAWFNLIVILIFMKPAIEALKDYEAQQKANKDPVFDGKGWNLGDDSPWKE